METLQKRRRILCVDDHAFVAEGLRSRLALESDLEWVGSLPTAEHLVQEVKRLAADIVMLDIEMPGPDPFEMLKDLHRRFPDVKTIILSAHVRDHYFQAAMEAGAWGYLSKGDAPDLIVEAIRKVIRGELAFGPDVEERFKLLRPGESAPKSAPESRLSSLTTREQQVLRMIGKGMSRMQIAKSLFRSPKTVDAHRTAIMEKLGIHDRVDLVRYAIREGLVEP
ncbi:MAG: response regulator [Planctomycetota bacterium]